MKLKRSMLPMVMWIGVAAITGCHDKVNVDPDNAGGAATTPPPAASESDTTAETATTAPPAPQADPQGSPPSPNDVWVGGAWRYAGGRYAWNRGRWESPRPGFGLIQARWAEEHGRWVHHPARWARRR